MKSHKSEDEFALVHALVIAQEWNKLRGTLYVALKGAPKISL